jgi:uncharacterized protein
MSDSPLVDVHVHLSESKKLAAFSTSAYEIWEYGSKSDVRFGRCDGDVDDLRGAMRAAGVGHSVVVNAFSIDEWRDRRLAGLERADGGPPPDDPRAPLASRLIRFNEWLVETAARFPDLTPFVAVDPWLLSASHAAAHLADMRSRGAQGVKIHPIDQRFAVADPDLLAIFHACVDLDLVVLAHSGPTRHGPQLAEPAAYACVLAAAPRLRLVVAHLGGASWRQTSALAADHPGVVFDLSEIVAWVGAPSAPAPDDLVRLIRDVGVDRVMFGSDFPWYDPGDMIQAVRDLPGLSEMECAAILGSNAVRILDLPVGSS